MIAENEFNLLRANPRFMAMEMQRRGIDVEVLDYDKSIMTARTGSHVELIQDIDTSVMPYATSMIASHKGVVKQFLRKEKLSVPAGAAFNVLDREDLLEVASQMNFPLVLKPVLGVQGDNVHMDIESLQDLEHAMNKIFEECGPEEVILEEQFEGHEYRVFVTRTGEYAVLHRDPAHVIGDGVSSIREIAEEESYQRMNPRKNCLCPIALDTESACFIRKNGFTFDSIPEAGEKIYLRGNSNVKTGGVPEDYTDKIHPSVIDLCRKALEAVPNLPYAGIDFMSKDITSEQTEDDYCILEINTLPGIGMHIAPALGEARNVPGMIVDLVFPETVVRDIRVAA